MKIKKVIASVIAAAFCCNMIAGTASAHNEDYWNGEYIGQNNGVRLYLRLDNSAITSLLTYSDVYKYGTDWNGISSKAEVSVINYAPGMPSIANQTLVFGKTYEDDTMGEAKRYTNTGSEAHANGNWSYVTIYMNTAPYVYEGEKNKTKAAKKVFLHEIGHALKLSHPIQIPYYEGHIYGNGAPYAIMNSGLPSTVGEWVSLEIAQHDKDNLIAKWGK